MAIETTMTTRTTATFYIQKVRSLLASRDNRDDSRSDPRAFDRSRSIAFMLSRTRAVFYDRFRFGANRRERDRDRN